VGVSEDRKRPRAPLAVLCCQALRTWRMSDQPDWMGQRACQPAQLLWAGGMDVHDDCGNEGSPWRRCTAVWEGIGTVTELLMPWQREVASSVRSDGHRRAGQAFVLLLLVLLLLQRQQVAS
jgi:hypothetical protein